MKDIFLTEWNYVGDKVRLAYVDGTEFFVSRKDFDRAFGCIVSAPRDDVIRDFGLDKGRTVFESMENKLLDPVHYPEIIKGLKDYLKVTTEEEAIAVGFGLVEAANKEVANDYNRYRYYFDVGNGFAGCVRVAIKPWESNKIQCMELDIPLCFCDNSNHIPDYKMMEHMERFTKTFGEEFDCYVCVGPMFEREEEPIDWHPEMDLVSTNEKYALKYEELALVKLQYGYVVSACLDTEGNLWKITQCLRLAIPRPEDAYDVDRGILGITVEKLTKE